jgi:hypothetical protein
MYFDALSFLEDERDAFRPYEALLDLNDAQLERPVDGAHGWSGRDLMGHLLAWQELALAAAKELAVGEGSPTKEQADRDWDASPDAGSRINDGYKAQYGALPMTELRDRFRTTAGELRGYLTVVPESRWIKHADHQNWFMAETIEHYEDHAKDLAAILEAAAP